MHASHRFVGFEQSQVVFEIEMFLESVKAVGLQHCFGIAVYELFGQGTFGFADRPFDVPDGAVDVEVVVVQDREAPAGFEGTVGVLDDRVAPLLHETVQDKRDENHVVFAFVRKRLVDAAVDELDVGVRRRFFTKLRLHLRPDLQGRNFPLVTDVGQHQQGVAPRPGAEFRRASARCRRWLYG